MVNSQWFKAVGVAASLLLPPNNWAKSGARSFPFLACSKRVRFLGICDPFTNHLTEE